MKPRIFVVQPLMENGLNALRQVGEVEVFNSERMISRDDLVAGVRRSDFVVTLGDTVIDAEILDVNPGLKGIAAMAMGLNVIDVEAATERGILLTNIDHVITKTTCDLTLAHILGLAWRIVEADRFTRSGRFHQEQSMSFLTHSLPGKVVGMIGLGVIGEEIAKRVRAFEMPVVYTKRNRLSEDRERQLGVQFLATKDDVLKQADFVVIMANYNPSTHLLIGAREFGLMKPTAFFVNTARGRIVDEPALLDALKTKQIAGAGLDVYWNEPPISEPNPNPEFFKMDNVILTSHIGSAAWESRTEMARLVAANMVAMVTGKRPANVYNPAVYERPNFRLGVAPPAQ
ncbi:MAG: NAD(P)-dependent oxidoreductase [Candidatus Dormibacteraceae bacterium]